MENQSKEGETSVALLESDSSMELNVLFPYTVTTSKGSAVFAKQFTILALSLITYSRGIFPAYAFSEKMYKGYPIKVLSGRRVCCDAHLFTKWLKSAFTALEKGYMKELILEVISLENVVLEHFSIMYQYKEDSVECNVRADDKKIVGFKETSFQKSVSYMISSVLNFMKKLEPLPEAFKLQLRVHYFDDRTPENFIPDYFRDGDLDSYEKTGMRTKSLGSIETPFHTIAMKISSCYELEKEYGTNANHVSNDRDLDKKRKLHIENQSEDKDETETKAVDAGPAQKKLALGDSRKVTILKKYQNQMCVTEAPAAFNRVEPTPDSEKSSPRSSKTNVNCICNLNTIKAGIFRCFKCSDWHHLICYRRKATSTVSRAVCVKCAAENHDWECLDSSFVSKSVPMSTIEKVAVFRQVVFKLRWFALISSSTLIEDFHVTEDQGKQIIDKLIKKKLLSPSTRSGDYIVHSNQLIVFINAYFK